MVRAREVVLPWVHVWSTTMSDRLRSVHFCFSRESSCYSDETRSHMFGGLNGTVLDGVFCCYGSAGSNTRPSDVQPHALSPRFEPHEEGGVGRGGVGLVALCRFRCESVYLGRCCGLRIRRAFLGNKYLIKPLKRKSRVVFPFLFYYQHYSLPEFAQIRYAQCRQCMTSRQIQTGRGAREIESEVIPDLERRQII